MVYWGVGTFQFHPNQNNRNFISYFWFSDTLTSGLFALWGNDFHLLFISRGGRYAVICLSIVSLYNIIISVMNIKIFQRNPSKKNKKSSSQYPRNWIFSHGAWRDNAKIQTQQNWAKLNQFYNMFCTLRNSRTFSPLQLNICHFPLFFLVYLFVF